MLAGLAIYLIFWRAQSLHTEHVLANCNHANCTIVTNLTQTLDFTDPVRPRVEQVLETLVSFFAPLVEKFGAALDAARSQTRTRVALCAGCWLLDRLVFSQSWGTCTPRSKLLLLFLW